VIYLKTPVSLQLARTAHDRNRPLLQTEDPEERLRTLYRERDPLYREVADLTLDTGRLSIRQIVRRIEERLNRPTAS